MCIISVNSGVRDAPYSQPQNLQSGFNTLPLLTSGFQLLAFICSVGIMRDSFTPAFRQRWKAGSLAFAKVSTLTLRRTNVGVCFYGSGVRGLQYVALFLKEGVQRVPGQSGDFICHRVESQ
ncbi:unnamed protein product [Ixodes pacificus]